MVEGDPEAEALNPCYYFFLWLKICPLVYFLILIGLKFDFQVNIIGYSPFQGQDEFQFVHLEVGMGSHYQVLLCLNLIY